MSQAIEEIQEAVRKAGESHAPLYIKGRGTWTSAYRHVSASRELSLWNFAGPQEYVPGNLTMTVRAGTTLQEIAEIAGAENQWLPLDPFGDDAGTIGATVATSSYGPLVTAFGTPRDLVLGVEAVLGSGDVVRGGGRVVKNVAGYDLSRLLTGSWGTLGAITEVTLRLFAKQEAEATILVQLPEKRRAAEKLLAGIRSAPVYPWAMELLDAQCARTLNVGNDSVLALRFGGNENVVMAQLAAIKSLYPAQEIAGDFWKSLTRMKHGWSMRISGLPSRLFDTFDSAARLIASVGAGMRTATPERGVVRIFFPSEVDSGKLFTALGQFAPTAQASGAGIVVEAMPSVSPLGAFSEREVANALSLGIKRVFDPNNVLNPGFLQQ